MITNELISEIKSNINDNHKQDITGGTLQGVLVDMVKGLCEVYPQTYTEEEKAQARANIDALSNHNGEITKEKLSLEVQAILNDVANKQNITDESLATIAKTIVGAINEVYKGGLKDASIATSKIEDGAITEPKLATDLLNIINSSVQPADLASAIAAAVASYVAKADIVSTTGNATDKVMSQHGVTEAINGVTNKVTELETEVNGIVSFIPQSLSGYVSGNYSSQTLGEGYYHSENINLNRGDVLTFSCDATGLMSAIAKLVDNVYYRIEAGRGGLVDYSYTATEDVVIIISGMSPIDAVSIKKNLSLDEIRTLVKNNTSTLNDVLGLSNDIKIIESNGYVSGNYESTAIVEDSGYRHSQPLRIFRGESIEGKMTAYGSMSAIAKFDGLKYNRISAGVGNSVYSYVANEDTDIVISYQANTLEYIKYTSNHKNSIEQIENLISGLDWKGKKWVVVGDSLTENNNRTTIHYHDYIKEITGISVVNLGISGTGWANGHPNAYPNGKAFWQRMNEVPTNADVVTIFGSFNDLGEEVTIPLGTISDNETTTICGCINKTIDNLLLEMPLVNLGIITPTPWAGYRPTSGGNSNAELYVNALIEICKMRSIPCLDLFHCSNLRPWDATFRALAYSKDEGNGVHPDEKGHLLIAPRFLEFIKTLFF